MTLSSDAGSSGNCSIPMPVTQSDARSMLCASGNRSGCGREAEAGLLSGERPRGGRRSGVLRPAKDDPDERAGVGDMSRLPGRASG